MKEKEVKYFVAWLPRLRPTINRLCLEDIKAHDLHNLLELGKYRFTDLQKQVEECLCTHVRGTTLVHAE